MNKKKSPGNIPLPGDFFLFKRIIRLYLTGSPYGAKRNCYSVKSVYELMRILLQASS